MFGSTKAPVIKTITFAGLALALLFGATAADAQDREGRWEFTLGALYQLGTHADFEGGSTIDTEDDFGFSLSTGYNISDKLNAKFGFSYADVGYDANVISDEGGDIGISGEYETWGLSAELLYNFMRGGDDTVRRRQHRLELDRHQRPDRAAGHGVLVGSVVGLRLLHRLSDRDRRHLQLPGDGGSALRVQLLVRSCGCGTPASGWTSTRPRARPAST